MAKFSGKIGYATTVQDSRGVWKDEITERQYYGEVIRNIRRLQSSDQVNDNVVVSNEISVVADPFANMNFHSIRYVMYMGAKWKVTNVTVQYPRLILTLGEVYNG